MYTAKHCLDCLKMAMFFQFLLASGCTIGLAEAFELEALFQQPVLSFTALPDRISAAQLL